MKSVAFIFPGQGKQKQGMLYSLYEKKTQPFIKSLEASLPFSVSQILNHWNTEDLSKARWAQVAVVLESLIIREYLKSKGVTPLVVAGFSVGEWSALAAAEILTPKEVLEAVIKRALWMSEEIERGGGDDLPFGKQAMAAVIGIPLKKLSALVSQSQIPHLYIANLNSQKQGVLSGLHESIELFRKELECSSLTPFRLVYLNTAGAFHSPLFKAVDEKMAILIEKFEWRKPKCPFISGVSAQIESIPGQIKQLMKSQVCSAVNWIAVSKEIQKLECEALVECGVGNVLKGLWRDQHSKVPCYSLGDFKKKVIESDEESSILCQSIVFDAKEGFYEQHFPGFKVVPGSLICDLFLSILEQQNISTPLVFKIKRMRFLSFVKPNEAQVKIEKKLFENKVEFRCYLLQNNKIKVKGLIQGGLK